MIRNYRSVVVFMFQAHVYFARYAFQILPFVVAPQKFVNSHYAPCHIRRRKRGGEYEAARTIDEKVFKRFRGNAESPCRISGFPQSAYKNIDVGQNVQFFA